MGSAERRQTKRKELSPLRKTLKIITVVFVVLCCYQLFTHYLWPGDILLDSDEILISQDWQPLLHVLTREHNVFDLLPLHTQAHVLPSHGVTLLQFTGYNTWFRQYFNRSNDYTFDRTYVDLLNALLKGEISRVILVHPFLRDSSHDYLPSATDYSIGTINFFIPTLQFASVNGEYAEHLDFRAICVCKIGHSHCSLPLLSHITRPIPVNLCAIQHIFIHEQVFDFVMESELLSANALSTDAPTAAATTPPSIWLKSESDTTSPTFSVVSIDMTYFGNPLSTATPGGDQKRVNYDEPADTTWKTELFTILGQMYGPVVLTTDKQTALRRVRSLLDLAYLCSYPLGSTMLADDSSNEGFPPGLCGSSIQRIQQLNTLAAYYTHGNGTNSSEKQSTCLRGLPLLLGLGNLTDMNPGARGRTDDLLSTLWFWLCSPDNFTRFRLLAMWTVCLQPTAEAPHQLVLCPRAAPITTIEQDGDNSTSKTLLLLARLESIMRNIPKPRLVVLNSGEVSESYIKDNHISRHLCRLIDSIFHSI